MNKLTATAVLTAMLGMPVLARADDSWTGFYAGIHAGKSTIKASGTSDSDPVWGLHVGYDHDFGNYVLGGELSYEGSAEYTVNGTTETTETSRLKIRGGHVFGRTYLYGIVGYANFEDGFSRLDGYSVGVGASFRATQNILIGGEYLRDVFSQSGNDVKADSLALRVSYQF